VTAEEMAQKANEFVEQYKNFKAKAKYASKHSPERAEYAKKAAEAEVQVGVWMKAYRKKVAEERLKGLR
jgi:hypothetical protein